MSANETTRVINRYSKLRETREKRGWRFLRFRYVC